MKEPSWDPKGGHFLAEFLTAFLISSSIVESANILGIFPYTARSHFAVYAPLIDELWSRGHNLTVVSHFPLSLGAGRPGLTAEGSRERYLDVSLVGTTPSLHGNLSLAGLNSAPLGLIDNIHQVFAGSEDYEEMLLSYPVRKLLASNSSFDLIIVEQFNTDLFLPLVHHFRAPYIAISPWPLTSWVRHRVDDAYELSMSPNSFGPFAIVRSTDLVTRARNTLYNLAFNLYHGIVVQPRAEQMARRLFPETPSLADIASDVSVILVNTHGSLHRPNSSPRIVEIGGQHLGRQDPKEREEIYRWLDGYSNNGTILFSLGSMFDAGSIPEAKMNIFRNALKRLPHKVIWKMALPSGENLKDGNVFYWNWVPQEIVLGHESVRLFIYHGGLLGVLEAVSNGVPILGLPMFGDMASNMAAVESAGAGEVLPYGTLTEDLFYDTIISIINNNSYKTNAKKLSAVFNDRPIRPLDLSVYWCEYVIQHNGAPHLRTQRLPWYRFCSLDVLCIFSVFLSLAVLVPVLIIKRLIKFYLAANRKTKES